MERMGLIFILFFCFSVCGLFAVILGYDLFHAKNPSGVLGIFYLVLCVVTLFLFMHLGNAFTGPLPAWYTYFSIPVPQPETKSMKRRLFIHCTIFYLINMAGLIAFNIGRPSLEQIALPLGIGLLTILLLNWLLSMFIAFRKVWKKDGKLSDSGDKAS